MKRVMVLFLVMAFMVSLAGCAPKSKYDKLLVEKVSLEKKCEQFSTERTALRTEIGDRKKEIGNLSGQLREARAQIRKLDAELVKSKQQLENLAQ